MEFIVLLLVDLHLYLLLSSIIFLFSRTPFTASYSCIQVLICLVFHCGIINISSLFPSDPCITSIYSYSLFTHTYTLALFLCYTLSYIFRACWRISIEFTDEWLVRTMFFVKLLGKPLWITSAVGWIVGRRATNIVLNW